MVYIVSNSKVTDKKSISQHDNTMTEETGFIIYEDSAQLFSDNTVTWHQRSPGGL